MKCFYCEKNIEPEEKKRMVALDIPYKNLWFHVTCLLEIENLQDYLLSNYNKIILYHKPKK